VLQQLSQDVLDQYPLSSDISSTFMYVNDVLASSHTKQSAALAIKELRGALDSARISWVEWRQRHLIVSFFCQWIFLSKQITPNERSYFGPKFSCKTFGCGSKAETSLFRLISSWNGILKGYPTLKEVTIPGWVRFHPATKLQYHGICDASHSAYGAAIFVRVETTDGCFTHLLTSKTRVVH